MTLLVAGLVVGGWALIFGFVALVVTLLGWLRDARREYEEVEDADRTGHLDVGPRARVAEGDVRGARAAPRGRPAAHLRACSPTPRPARRRRAARRRGGGGTGGSAAPPSAAPSLPAADTTITAQNTAFVETSVTAPAAKPFTIAFDNRDDGQPHDVAIHDASRRRGVHGQDRVTGPTVVVYDVPALPAGTYSFVCSVHPNMTGTLTTK